MYVTYPNTPHVPLGIENHSLVTDTELGTCLGLFLSKLALQCQAGKTNSALLCSGSQMRTTVQELCEVW